MSGHSDLRPTMSDAEGPGRKAERLLGGPHSHPGTPKRRGDLAGSASARAVSAGAHNLPSLPTSFVGRERELAEVISLLDMTRLLTLTGPGGAGKTRLALEAARALVPRFPQGTRLVELAALPDSTSVPAAVAAVLAVHQEPDRPILDAILDALESTQVLLVLDNCEHLSEACAELADALLAGCPDLRILATSRQPLGVAGELIWQVPPLPLPVPSACADPIELAKAPAVGLFVDRVRSQQPSFHLTQANGDAVVEICQRLDGLPLAIELAAARVEELSIEQIAAGLGRPLQLLTATGSSPTPHHRTLRLTLDWSYDLLSSQERRLIDHLSVFAGGWTPEAASVVCSDDELEAGVVADLVLRLEDRSLVTGRVGPDGEIRYSMLEPVRQYCRERLEQSGRAEQIERRHYECFLALGEAAERELTGPDQGKWLDRLERERDNLRAVLSWARERAVDGSGAELTLRLAGALWRYWQMHGYQAEAWEWLDAGLGMEGRVAPQVRAKALSAAGMLAWEQGDYERAGALHQESLELRRSLGDRVGVAASLNNLGLVALERGDLERATQLHEESLEVRRELGDSWGIAVSLNNLGLVALERGEYQQARTLFEESLSLRRGLGNIQGTGTSLNNLGLVALREGDYARAKSLFEESLGLHEGLGDALNVALVLSNLGRVALYRGEHERSKTLWKQSLELYWRTRSKVGIAECLEGLAVVAQMQGEETRAFCLWGAAEALREAMGSPVETAERAGLAERLFGPVRAQLGEDAFRTALSEGKGMRLQQAVEYALDQN